MRKPCYASAAVTYTISDPALEYDAIINAACTKKVSRAQQKSSYSYTRVTRLSYQILEKKDSSWLINTKLQSKSLQKLLLLLMEDQTNFADKVENFYNPTIKKMNIMINGVPHQLFEGSILPHDMYLEISKKFLREKSNVSFEEYLTTKYKLWIDTRLSANKISSIVAADW